MQRKKPQWHLGELTWYDSKTGHGCIIGDDGKFYRVRPSEKRQGSLSKFKRKARVKFLLANDSIHPVVTEVESASKSAKTSDSIQLALPFEKVRSI